MEEEFILRYKVLKKISHLRAADCVHGAYAVGPLLLQVPLLTYISVPPERWWSPQVWPLPSALLQEGSRHGRCSADAGWVSQFLDLLRCLVCGWCLKAKVELSCLRLVSSWIVREAADFHCCFFFFLIFLTDGWNTQYVFTYLIPETLWGSQHHSLILREGSGRAGAWSHCNPAAARGPPPLSSTACSAPRVPGWSSHLAYQDRFFQGNPENRC